MTEYTRGELQDKIQQWANANKGYRAALLKDPTAVLSAHLGTELPEDFEVEIVQDTPNKMYVAMPQQTAAAGDELSDDDLENVAGGALFGGGGTIFGGGGSASDSASAIQCDVNDVDGDVAIVSNTTITVEGNMDV